MPAAASAGSSTRAGVRGEGAQLGDGRLEVAEPVRRRLRGLRRRSVGGCELPLQVFVLDCSKLLRHGVRQVAGEPIQDALSHFGKRRRQRRLEVVAHLLQPARQAADIFCVGAQPLFQRRVFEGVVSNFKISGFYR